MEVDRIVRAKRLLNIGVPVVLLTAILIYVGFLSQIIPFAITPLLNEEYVYHFRVIEGYIWNYIIQFELVYLVWRLSWIFRATWGMLAGFFCMTWVGSNIILQALNIGEVSNFYILPSALLFTILFFVVERYMLDRY